MKCLYFELNKIDFKLETVMVFNSIQFTQNYHIYANFKYIKNINLVFTSNSVDFQYIAPKFLSFNRFTFIFFTSEPFRYHYYFTITNTNTQKQSNSIQ